MEAFCRSPSCIFSKLLQIWLVEGCDKFKMGQYNGKIFCMYFELEEEVSISWVNTAAELCVWRDHVS